MPSTTDAAGLKFLFISCFLFALIKSNWAEDAQLQKFREECIKEQGNLTPAEIQRVNKGKVVTKERQDASNNLQCFQLCMYKKFGLMKADGKQNPEAIIKYMQRVVKDKSKLMPILANCASKKTDNPCSTVYNFESCIMQQI